MIDVKVEIEKMENLQRYKDTQTIFGILDVVTTTVCDHLCKYTQEATQEELEELCEHCPLNKF